MAVAAVILVAVLGRFVWDDVVSGEDIPRGVSVQGVAIGNTDRTAAASRIEEGVVADREVSLTWAETTSTATLAEWGVHVDVEATLDAAAATRGSGPNRFLRWLGALVRDRKVDPVWAVDPDRLQAAFGPDAIDLAFVQAIVELGPAGEFVAIDHPAIPLVDIDALVAALITAADDPTITTIEVPVGGEREIEGGRPLATAANELTDSPLTVIAPASSNRAPSTSRPFARGSSSTASPSPTICGSTPIASPRPSPTRSRLRPPRRRTASGS
ncbi:MAG: hypothetical protein R2695_01450 [Acidimicrobiales bacterium]